MSPLCPAGHDSATADYCDQCGAPIGSAPAQPTEVLPVVEEDPTEASAPAQDCPACGTARAGRDRYCEACGHDFAAPVSSGRWEIVVSADRAQFERAGPDGMAFPADLAPRRIELSDRRIEIGREGPIVAGGDPAASRRHAVLARQQDGSYAIVDQGSTNGTTLNDDPTPLAPHVPVTLADGDRVHLGAWTTIAVRRVS